MLVRLCPSTTMTDSNVCQILKNNVTAAVYGWEGIPEAIVFNSLISSVRILSSPK